MSNDQRIKNIVILLFAWSTLWVSTFALFLVQERFGNFPFLEGHVAIRYIKSSFSIGGELALGLACILKLVSFVRGRYGPLWLNVMLVLALAVNYWHWVLIGNVVSQ